jgi:predicted transcriptional regulator
MSFYSKRFYFWLGEINQLPRITHFLGSLAIVVDNKTKKKSFSSGEG